MYHQQYNLGNFKKKYGRSFFHSPWWPFTYFVALLLILVLILTSVPNVFQGANIGFFLLFLVMALIVVYYLAPHARGIIKELQAGKPLALLYDQGFIISTDKGNQQMVARWTDVDVWHEVKIWKVPIGGGGLIIHVPVWYFNSYTVTDRTTKAPTKLLFGAEFSRAVEAAVATCQHPSVQAAYRSGQIINFGRLSVSLQGLYDMTISTMLAWNDIESIKISRCGSVRIRQRGQRRGWASIPFGQLANLATLRRLLETDGGFAF